MDERFLGRVATVVKSLLQPIEDEIALEIEDFISPTTVERLREQSGTLQPKIDDWRAMVDCVMVDPAYDGEIFNVALSDVPERKADLVSGKYTIPAPAGATTVAVRFIDMLGEEVLVIQNLDAPTRKRGRAD